MDAEQGQIEFLVEPDHCLLKLRGSLGTANADEFCRVAVELCAYRKDIVVEWAEGVQVDASIVQILLALRAELADVNAALRCPSLPQPVRAYLETAGLSELFGEVALTA